MQNAKQFYQIQNSIVFFASNLGMQKQCICIEFLPPLIGCQFCNTGRNIKYHSCRSLFIRVESFQSNNIAVLILLELEVYVHQALMICKAEIHKRSKTLEWYLGLVFSL